jgi:hypothetical protein
VPPSGPPTVVPTIGTAITALNKTVAFASRDRRAHHRRTKQRYSSERKRTDLIAPCSARSATPAAYSAQSSISLQMRQIRTGDRICAPYGPPSADAAVGSREPNVHPNRSPRKRKPETSKVVAIPEASCPEVTGSESQI